MPFQNRVNPFGMIVADSARGTLMGNRGCLHDDQDHPVRQYQCRRWISCVLDFQGRVRAPMPPSQYTSLFFLDEATALAAGYRPCAEGQRERFDAFRQHWTAANPELAGDPMPPATAIDAALHRERITPDRSVVAQRKITYTTPLHVLPAGAFVVLPTSDTPHLVLADALVPWTLAGYGQALKRSPNATVVVLTPRSIVRALAHGYCAELHASARRQSRG